MFNNIYTKIKIRRNYDIIAVRCFKRKNIGF